MDRGRDPRCRGRHGARTMHSRRGANESSPAEKTSTPRANDALATARFLPTVENKNRRHGKAPAGMVWIPGSEFSMGAQDLPDMHDTVGMQAIRRLREATDYITVAERKPRQEDFPTAPPENLTVGSVVFSPPNHAVPLNDHFQRWAYVDGANSRHPLGRKARYRPRNGFRWCM
jgi:formylglycine-generating enzyme